MVRGEESDGEWLTSSKLSSSASISLNRRAPRTSVGETIRAGVAIFASLPLTLSLSLFFALKYCTSTQKKTTAMAPPLYSWPASELPDHTRANVKDEFRKGFDGNLKACELLEMLQYRCEVENPGLRSSPTRCWPVERLFRR